ncbi:hypothetical protein [Bacillus massilinigeriensis]|uniref:hypothetical protein n=1 Tax=Bacillus mediterraneensis TaxID=1805474 RepID=UPI0008F8FE89|nr:hypothetical protein [Bacillus mediterraneensis]
MLKKMLLTTLLITGILSGCGGGEEDKEVEDKITKEAIEYVKKNEDKTFIPDHLEYTDAIGGGTCWVIGHYEDEPNKEISVQVVYDQEEDYYKADSIGSN